MLSGYLLIKIIKSRARLKIIIATICRIIIVSILQLLSLNSHSKPMRRVILLSC